MRTGAGFVVLLVLAGAVQACRTDTVPTTHPVGQPVRPSSRAADAGVPTPPPPLLDQLSRPEMHFGRRKWAEWFNRTSCDPAHRDMWLADVSLAAGRRGDAVRVLVMEVFEVGTPAIDHYDRVGVYLLPDGAARDERLEELGLVRLYDARHWARTAECANRLLRSGASAALEKPVFGCIDGAVVSSFDRGRWEHGSWLYLGWRADWSDAKRAEDLPPESRALFNLVQLVNGGLADVGHPPFADDLKPFIEQFGEFGRQGGGGAEPRTP